MRARFLNIISPSPPKNLRPLSQLFSSSILPTDSDHFPEKIPLEVQSPKPPWIPSQNEVLDTLLLHKADPRSALMFFKQVERLRGFVKTVDVWCLLLQILASSPDTRGDAKYLLNNYVFGGSAPAAKVLVELLVECAGRYGFELSDSRVFNYLLNSYVRANKITEAVECFRTMLERGVLPWVPVVNILLTAMVWRNMADNVHQVYDEMVEREIYGDCYTLHILMRACLKGGRFVEAWNYFGKAVAGGLKLDAAAYSLVIQAICRVPDLNLACKLLKEMKELGWVPSEGTYVAVIGACVRQGNFKEALRLKDEMVSSGGPMNVVVARSLIKGHCMRGDLNSALRMFDEVVEAGVTPNVALFSDLIDWCSKIGNVEKANELYTRMKLMDLQPTVFIVNFLLKGFRKQNLLESAYSLLDEAVENGIATVDTYNIVFLWLCELGKVNEACNLWDKMIGKGIMPSLVSYNHMILGHPPFSFHPNVAQFSRNLDPPLTYSSPGTATGLIKQAKQEQLAATAYSVHNMLEVNSKLKQLVKQGQLRKARNMFEKMDHRDEISWTTLIGGYVNASDPYEALFLFSNMWVQPGLQRDQFMISVALKACALGVNICHGELLHGFSVKSGLINSVFVSSALIDMYMKVGKIEEGCRVFEKMIAKNVVSWTAIIAGLVHAGYNMEGLLYFSEMWRSKVGYDSHTFSIALKASADSSLLHHGKAIHTQTIKQGFDESSFVINTLATMYNKCGKPDYVMRLFEKMRMPDVVSWTNLIMTYVQMGEDEHAVKVFKRMRKSDVPPNKFTFAAIISACANLSIAKWGEQIHGHVFRLGWVDALSVANSLITLYSQCGLLTSASLVFRDITRKDIISWSTIIAVYSHGGYAKEAFDYLSWMRREGPRPNEFAISSILSVCGSMALLEQGKQVHAHVLCIGIDHEAMVHSALISMYSKCGSVQEASKIFDGLKTNDIISWTAMINGYAEHGYSQEAIELFEKISSVGLMPDYVTFIGVLTACSHAGMVDLGFFYFLKMTNEYQINPSKEHYGCMIDLLCRAGQLSEAEHMIRTMPFHSDDVVWSTLLRACREHGDVDRGRRTAEQLLQLDPNSAGTHITLANIYASKGRWMEVADIRKLMKSKGVIKERGWSWINVNDQLNAFVAGDQAHPQSEHITTILELLRVNIVDARQEIRSLHKEVED